MLQGICRYINRVGDMIEGKYTDSKLSGWCRTLHNDGYYTVSWCEDGMDMGYCKMFDNKSKESFEGLYYEVDTHIWDKDIKYDHSIDDDIKKEYYR